MLVTQGTLHVSTAANMTHMQQTVINNHFNRFKHTAKRPNEDRPKLT